MINTPIANRHEIPTASRFTTKNNVHASDKYSGGGGRNFYRPQRKQDEPDKEAEGNEKEHKDKSHLDVVA